MELIIKHILTEPTMRNNQVDGTSSIHQKSFQDRGTGQAPQYRVSSARIAAGSLIIAR
jgi:hypothetical protein